MSLEDLVRPTEIGALLARSTADERWRQVEATLIAGGKSNLTYLLSSDAGELVLRRPPSGELLPSAHDMAREAWVQGALAATNVPVPTIVHAAGADSVLGVPFYVMEKVEGRIIRDPLPDDYATSVGAREAMSFGLVDTLADLHAVDPGDVGLDGFGRPAGFVERQLRRWRTQWDATKTADLDDLDRLGALLGDRLPAEGRAAVVHGDFRLDNCMLASEDPGTVAAVLDWELSTLGDPMTDLGMLLFYWREPGEPTPVLTPAPSQLPGFPGRDRMVERYAARTGAEPADVAFYEAFAHFKFAIIAQGIAARTRAGAMAGQDFGSLDHEVERIVAAGLDCLAVR